MQDSITIVKTQNMQNTSASAYTNVTVPIPGFLQGDLIREIIGKGGSNLKAMTLGEDGEQDPNLKGVRVMVLGEKGSGKQYMSISHFANDSRAPGKVDTIKTKISKQFNDLMEKWGQTQQTNSLPQVEDFVVKRSVCIEALKPKTGVRKPDIPSGCTLFQRQEDGEVGDYEARKSKANKSSNSPKSNKSSVKVIDLKDTGFDFLAFDYDEQTSKFSLPVDETTKVFTGGSRLQKTNKAGSRPRRWRGSLQVGWFANKTTKEAFPLENLENPSGLIISDFVTVKKSQRTDKNHSSVAEIVAFEGEGNKFAIVNLQWVFGDQKLVKWTTRHLEKYSFTTAECEAVDKIRQEQSDKLKKEEMEAVEKKVEQEEKSSIAIHTYTPLDEAWEHYESLMRAVETGNTSLFKDLIREREINGVDFGSWPAQKPILHWVAQHGRISMAEYLIEQLGFPVNMVGKHGNTELHRALWHDKIEMANYLFDVGSDDSIQNEFGERPGEFPAEDPNAQNGYSDDEDDW